MTGQMSEIAKCNKNDCPVRAIQYGPMGLVVCDLCQIKMYDKTLEAVKEKWNLFEKKVEEKAAK